MGAATAETSAASVASTTANRRMYTPRDGETAGGKGARAPPRGQARRTTRNVAEGVRQRQRLFRASGNAKGLRRLPLGLGQLGAELDHGLGVDLADAALGDTEDAADLA